MVKQAFTQVASGLPELKDAINSTWKNSMAIQSIVIKWLWQQVQKFILLYFLYNCS